MSCGLTGFLYEGNKMLAFGIGLALMFIAIMLFVSTEIGRRRLRHMWWNPAWWVYVVTVIFFYWGGLMAAPFALSFVYPAYLSYEVAASVYMLATLVFGVIAMVILGVISEGLADSVSHFAPDFSKAFARGFRKVMAER